MWCGNNRCLCSCFHSSAWFDVFILWIVAASGLCMWFKAKHVDRGEQLGSSADCTLSHTTQSMPTSELNLFDARSGGFHSKAKSKHMNSSCPTFVRPMTMKGWKVKVAFRWQKGWVPQKGIAKEKESHSELTMKAPKPSTLPHCHTTTSPDVISAESISKVPSLFLVPQGVGCIKFCSCYEPTPSTQHGTQPCLSRDSCDMGSA